MATRLHPFDAACEHLAPLTADGRKWKWIEVASKSKIYELLNNHVPSNLIDEDDAEYPDACKQLAASEAWAQSFKVRNTATCCCMDCCVGVAWHCCMGAMPCSLPCSLHAVS